MTNAKEYITISDEHLNKELSTDDGLLIIGKTGSGKTKLVNRLLRQLEQQPDAVYLFVTHDLFNHTGDGSYGHLNAVHVSVDDLGYEIDEAKNTAIALSYEELGAHLEDVLTEQLRPYIERLSDLCVAQNKKLYIVSDDLDGRCNHEIKRLDSPYKPIISLTVNDDFRVLVSNYNTIQL